MRGPKVIFRDEHGRFVKQADRYKPIVKLIQALRGGRYVDVGERALPPETLADVLSRPEFESLPEASVTLATFKSKAKYKAWDVAKQIDKFKGIRRKDIKLVVRIQDGKRTKEINVYHKIKSNRAASYSIFRRINEELGFNKMFLYNTVNGKHLADRKGKKVTLLDVRLEQIM